MFQFSNLLTTHRRFTHMSFADEWPLEVRYPYRNYANVVQLTVHTNYRESLGIVSLYSYNLIIIHITSRGRDDRKITKMTNYARVIPSDGNES